MAMRQIYLLRIARFIIGMALYAFFAVPAVAYAQGQFDLLGGLGEQCRTCGACSICDLLGIMTKGMRYLISLSGGIALAIFVYGGFELMMSQGKSEQVEAGKKMITGTVVALGIILLMAWIWPNWVVIALKGIPAGGKPQSIFANDAWWLTPCRNYTATEKCVDKPRPAPLDTASTGCMGVDPATGAPSGFKSAGTTCELSGACKQAPCTCSPEGQCVNGCRTEKDCAGFGGGPQGAGPYCRKTAGSELGWCVLVHPGDPCDPGCPVAPLKVFRQATGPYMLLTCDSSSKTCLIKESAACWGQYESKCVPGTECLTRGALLPGKVCRKRNRDELGYCKINCTTVCAVSIQNKTECSDCITQPDPSCVSGVCECYQCTFDSNTQSMTVILNNKCKP